MTTRAASRTVSPRRSSVRHTAASSPTGPAAALRRLRRSPMRRRTITLPSKGQPQGERQQESCGRRQGERQDRGPRPDRPFQDRNNQQNRQGPTPIVGRVRSAISATTSSPVSSPVRRRATSSPTRACPLSSPRLCGFRSARAMRRSRPCRAALRKSAPEMGQDEGVGFHLRPRRRRRRPGAEGEGETAAPRGEQPALD